jgi:hypothetical protein
MNSQWSTNLIKTHIVVDVLSRLSNSSKPLGVLDQTMDASLFFIEPIWMQGVKSRDMSNAKNFELTLKTKIG